MQPTKEIITNPTSERALLSICMNDNDKLIDVDTAGITHKMFGIEANRYLFMAIQYLYSKKIATTPLSIMEVLASESARSSIETMGGIDHIAMISEGDADVDSLPIFMAKIKQASVRRGLVSVCEDTIQFVKSEQAEVLNPSELIGSHEGKLVDLSPDEKHSLAYKMGDDTDRVLLEREESPESVPGLEVGWAKVDRITNGFMPGDLTIVCGESKTGKSVLLMNWAIQLSIIDKIPILYIDTEMSARECEDRILANLSGVPHSEIVSGMYVMDTEHGKAEQKIIKVKEAKELMQAGHYHHIYMPQFDIDAITALTKKFMRQHGVEALFFDYIKIPSSDTGFKNSQEYQMLGFLTSGLKDIAGIMEIPVFSACQANRANLGEEKKDASAIGGSYRILQLASKLMFLTNKSDESIASRGPRNGNQVLQIAYQRNGESNCDPIDIIFDRPWLVQREV